MNCEDDLGVLLTQLKRTNSVVYETKGAEKKAPQAITLPDYDYRTESMTTQNPFIYVCGYLISKALRIHSCDICIQFSNQSQALDKNKIFLQLKAFGDKEGIFGSLKSPSEEFIHYIYKLENIFLKFFDDVSNNEGISHFFLTK